jgi:hypothetical protein
MPPELRAKFPTTVDVTFDVDEEHKLAIKTKFAFKSSPREIAGSAQHNVCL